MILQHAQLLTEVPVDVQKSYLENLQAQAHIFNPRNVPTKSFWKKITNTNLKMIYLIKSIHRQLGEHNFTLRTKVHQMFWQKFPCPIVVVKCNHTQTTDIRTVRSVWYLGCAQRICIKE